MTKEMAIEKAKEQYSEIWDCDINHPKYEDTVEEIVTGVIRLIMQPTSDDCVSLGAYKQVMWERNIAIEQLKELGYEFGEKIRISDDCVSREEVLNSMLKFIHHWVSECPSKELLADLEDRINDLTYVTPTQRWVPVSERLPEESGNYILYGKVVDYEENCVFIGEYDSDYEMFGYKEDIYDSETLGFLDSEFCEYNKVIAWQPLPKPYEEKRGSKNE